jgi:hypothetical protein
MMMGKCEAERAWKSADSFQKLTTLKRRICSEFCDFGLKANGNDNDVQA